MSADNKAVVTRLIEARNANDTEAFVSLFAPEMQDHVRGAFVGVSQAFPDVHITVEEMIAEGDKVVARWTFNGTHLNTFRDIPATGRSVTWKGIDIYTVKNGEITSHERESDILGLIQQLGVAPPKG